ncbi:MAG: BMP family ABC transporter substrate-binding protein, partial [Clostridiales bacterium]|nr:BMP family ABC transporter substrate-binding protein [Clostridiales bacterium]
MKKILIIVVAVLMLATVFSGCKPAEEEALKVGLVTDSGTIDDKSFNQGTWEGLEKAAKELGLEYTYLKPTGETKEDYLREIGNLYDTGHRFIVTPGYKFSVAIHEAQTKYPDCKFVLVDAPPHAGDYVPDIAENTVAILYNEHISGFLAGVAVAVEMQEGELAFIGGEPVPPVQKYNWGFQQGIAYANENYGTACTMQAENFIYQGTFYEVEAGQQIAAAMFDKGVKAIFCAAGGVGVGAINE